MVLLLSKLLYFFFKWTKSIDNENNNSRNNENNNTRNDKNNSESNRINKNTVYFIKYNNYDDGNNVQIYHNH